MAAPKDIMNQALMIGRGYDFDYNGGPVNLDSFASRPRTEVAKAVSPPSYTPQYNWWQADVEPSPSATGNPGPQSPGNAVPGNTGMGNFYLQNLGQRVGSMVMDPMYMNNMLGQSYKWNAAGQRLAQAIDFEQMMAAQNSPYGQSRLATEMQARANSAKAAKAAVIEARAKSQDAATAFAQGGLNRSMFGQHGPVSYSGNYRVG